MKLKTLLAAFAIVLGMTACDDNVYDRIPETTVYLKLNTETTAKELKAILGYLEYPKGTYTYSDSYLGYGGLLIINGMDGVIRAFDMACPVEARTTSLIRMDDTGLQAVCSTCGSTFSVGDIDACGSPVEGEAREKLYFLRRYNVSHSQSSGDLYIIN